jgi:hypothetical protein
VGFRARENLTLKLSRDGGATWPVQRVIEPGISGYSDLAEGMKQEGVRAPVERIVEPAREVPVVGECDVLVCGGGPAGCAAALAAARQGASTLLVEREGYLGGSPATQFVTSILTTNGVDCQGVWHDPIRELRRRDGATGLAPHPKALCGYILAGAVDPEAIRHAWTAPSWRRTWTICWSPAAACRPITLRSPGCVFSRPA